MYTQGTHIHTFPDQFFTTSRTFLTNIAVVTILMYLYLTDGIRFKQIAQKYLTGIWREISSFLYFYKLEFFFLNIIFYIHFFSDQKKILKTRSLNLFFSGIKYIPRSNKACIYIKSLRYYKVLQSTLHKNMPLKGLRAIMTETQKLLLDQNCVFYLYSLHSARLCEMTRTGGLCLDTDITHPSTHDLSFFLLLANTYAGFRLTYSWPWLEIAWHPALIGKCWGFFIVVAREKKNRESSQTIFELWSSQRETWMRAGAEAAHQTCIHVCKWPHLKAAPIFSTNGFLLSLHNIS